MDPKSPKDLTPEERLFKIIQDSEKSSEGDTLLVSDNKKNEELRAEAVFEDDKKTEKPITEKGDSFFAGLGAKIFSIRFANRVLFVLFAGVLVFFVGHQFAAKYSPSDLFMKRANAMDVPVMHLPENFFVVQNLNREAFSDRNVFKPWKQPAPEATATATGPSSTVATLAAQLKLSGIYQDAVPEALLEALDEKKTYVVSAGKQIKGLTVKEVKSNGVLVTDGQSEFLIQ